MRAPGGVKSFVCHLGPIVGSTGSGPQDRSPLEDLVEDAPLAAFRSALATQSLATLNACRRYEAVGGDPLLVMRKGNTTGDALETRSEGRGRLQGSFP